jgi:hypothetical protein
VGTSVAVWVGLAVGGGAAGAAHPTKAKFANNIIVNNFGNRLALPINRLLYLEKIKFKSLGLESRGLTIDRYSHSAT